MTLDLSEVEFSYDFFSMSLPDGSTLILNRIDEDIELAGTETPFSAVNIVVSPEEGESELCSSVIGTSNSHFTLDTPYPEYLGKTLTPANMKFCTMEIPEDD